MTPDPRLSGTHHHLADNVLDLNEAIDEASPTPADTVVEETTFGQASDVGVSDEYSRGDHTHGTPDEPEAEPFDVLEADGEASISNPTQIITPNGSLSQPSSGVAVLDMRPVVSLYDATGATDGARVDFPLPDFCVPDSVMVWEDGLMLRPVVDYNEDSDYSGVTLASAPASSTPLLIRYEAEQA
jgi:hypothetical protein